MRFRLTGNYGTFEITRVVEADDEDDAYCETGITSTLEAAGWTVSAVDGEDWEVELLDDEDPAAVEHEWVPAAGDPTRCALCGEHAHEHYYNQALAAEEHGQFTQAAKLYEKAEDAR